MEQQQINRQSQGQEQQKKQTVYQDKFQKRYETEKLQHINQGAKLDGDNGSIIRTSKKEDKLQAQSREGNIALEVDRPELPSISFKDFKADLLEKQNQVLSKPPLKFLDQNLKETEDQDTVIMVSFPRSGNTLLRAYLEKIMGLTSGSDCDITKKLNKDLMLMGLAGEGLVDKRVLIVKTHYPERYGKTKFYAERAILLVRNPIDSITSLYNMVCTGSHNRSISDKDFEKFPQMWAEFIEQDITVWNDFHQFWMNAKIPVHIIRYEDILNNPEPTLKSLLEFILNTPDISGTKVHQYLKIAVGQQSPQIYQPRKGVANGSFDKFNHDQLSFILEYSQKFLKMYNYIDTFQQFGISQDYEDESIKNINPYQFIENFNHEALKKSIKLQNEADEITSIYINYPALLLRKKSELYPEGRTSHKFKNYLRRRVTIVDKNQNPIDPKEVKDQTEVDEAEQENAD